MDIPSGVRATLNVAGTTVYYTNGLPASMGSTVSADVKALGIGSTGIGPELFITNCLIQATAETGGPAGASFVGANGTGSSGDLTISGLGVPNLTTPGTAGGQVLAIGVNGGTSTVAATLNKAWL